ncbi:MAG: nucleotidyl transferase AbiEii/AbiGii toxin family protein [Bacteroidetes bacterium]|nr:nucleotidyl transferase AbiEii/AbiGii toxin family protein [Bacteroidota bacterium]
MIRDWGTFEKINSVLCRLPGFAKSSVQKQRFLYRKKLILDIIPFGEIARSDRNIYWPPDETPVMSVFGFIEMASKALSVTIDGELIVKVASLPGIFVLKLVAWHDRYWKTNKDAEDLAGLIDEYFETNLDRVSEAHPDIFEAHDFTTFTAGAVLMGRDIRTFLAGNDALLQELVTIFNREIDKAEDSVLISQILETHRSKKYEEIHRALDLLTQEIRILT